MNSVHNETIQDESLSLAFLGRALALAFVALVIANGLLFIFYYGDTFTPLALPYRETFENRWRLDYRQFGGQWHLRDNALVQSNTQDTDLLAVIPLTIPPEQHYHFGTQIKILQGPNGGGLMFNLQHPNSRQQSHLVRFGNADGKDYLVFGYFDENLQFVAQGSLLPPDLTQGVELAVLVHDQSYDVLVNGQPQQLEIPLQYRGGKLALTTWFSSVTFDDVYITALSETPDKSAAQPIQTTVITANTSTEVAEPVVINAAAGITQPMLPVDDNVFFSEQFSNNTNQTLWTTLTGKWQFEDGALVQQNPDGYDYTISRAGVFTRYALSVRFRHRQGVGGGLLFNMPEGDTKHKGHLVRYFEDKVLAWGYFDNENVFNGQGNATVDPPGDQPHILQVIVDDTTYAIFLDNRMIAENVPLVSTDGHIGLTASKSIVAFEEIITTQIQ